MRCGLPVENGKPVRFSQVPCVTGEEFRREILGSVLDGAHLSSFFGLEVAAGTAGAAASRRLVVVLTNAPAKTITVLSTPMERTFPSLTPDCPQAQMFEREIAEQWNVTPEGHPWLRPARFHDAFPDGHPSRRGAPRRAGSAFVALPETHTSCVQSIAPTTGGPAEVVPATGSREVQTPGVDACGVPLPSRGDPTAGNPGRTVAGSAPTRESGRCVEEAPHGSESRGGAVPASSPLGADRGAASPSNEGRQPGVADFFRVEGEESHEVAVGPVHAGVIEPGHFRFQCHGEQVFHLEISLGYQHRGIEQALLGGPHKRTLFQMETIAGDTTVGHTWAFCQAMEALSGREAPPRAQALRAVGLELERLANHTGDLGALGGDVGFLPTAAYCGRIRGDFLNMTALLCGSRLGRGLLRVGGTGFDLDTQDRLDKLLAALSRADSDTRTAIQLLWDTPAVMSRFENTGVLTRETGLALGLVGPAARACGIQQDVRLDFPGAPYREFPIAPVPNPDMRTGDVAARAVVRWAEIQNSLRFLQGLLPKLPGGPILAPEAPTPASGLAPDALIVSLVEGWRGEICHTVVTDAHGRFARYKIVDPSFHNWIGLGMALRGQAISDFPLCNKSFNLSYCGFDL